MGVVAQQRNEELQEQWGEQIDLRQHYLNLFGDVADRVAKQWATRGGYEGFGQYVIDAAAPFDHAPVNPAIWTEVRPHRAQTLAWASKPRH